MTRRSLLATLVVLLVWSQVCSCELGTVYYNSAQNTYSFQSGVIDKSGAAYGSFDDNIEVDGWARLHITSNSRFEDEQQMYAAGFLEGALTQARIAQHYVNIYSNFFGNISNPVPTALKNWLQEQNSWAHKQALALKDSDNYWAQVHGILQQFDGLAAGYNAVAPADKQLPTLAFSILNGVGDLLDLMNALTGKSVWARFRQNEDWIYNSHCSALIKVTGNLQDLFTGHTSWFVFAAMMRIAKDYNFPLNNPGTASQRVVFSSYPGFLESLDDYYITSSQLVVIETSNSIFNQSLYQIVASNTDVLLSWQRTLLANRMSSSGADWANYYSKYQSGTYNNQWMVVDAKKFQPGQPLNPGTLTILEQIPGTIVWDDLTDQLEKGYWPSYNVPYFTKIYDMSGYIAAAKSDQVMASYQLCCRANIFRRDQGTVTDLETFKHILRYNEWQTDPYSFHNPGYAIASRFDLESNKPGAFGGYDTKASSWSMIKEMKFQAINGPTYQDQTPFSWTSEWDSVSHVGLPQTFKFPFIEFGPKDF